jgi:uncharacterized protein
MIKKNIYIIVAIVVVILALILFWQRNIATIQQSPAQNIPNDALEGDHSLENTVGESPNFMEDLRSKEYNGGEIKIESTITENDTYTSYLISYPSEVLNIYGVMNIPKGEGPFPVIVLNHGYYNPSEYKSGDGTRNIADILVHEGYITVASDYRGHGNSDNDSGNRGGHRPEYAIDVLNLIASIKSINQADTNRIGMWGHSMGGEVSLRTIIATDKVKALVLWAPTSADAADNLGYYGGHNTNSVSVNPKLKNVSPINYLTYVQTPISIHQGLEDTEVNPEWSRELNDALKKEGKKVEYFEYEGQDHNFRNLGWEEVSNKTISFFATYLQK